MPADPKIIDIISVASSTPFVSLEYFPPRSDDGVKNLYSRMERMKETVKPAFTDVTWGAGGSTADLSLEIALQAHNTGHIANLHMTCTNIAGSTDPKQDVQKALQTAYDGGIRNIVALRGDPPAGQEEWKAAEGGFTCALDLVKFIRNDLPFGSEMGISVAGYPEGHPNAISKIDDPSTLTPSELARSSVLDGVTYTCKDEDYKKEMEYLKEKIDAGSDFIITQMFFDADVFLQFVKDCRAIGIDCPIVPGLMCINAYAGFVKMTKFCKTRVPQELRESMDAIKDDAEAVKQFGIDFGVKICQKLLDGGATVLHFYTLNLEKVVYGVLDGLGLSQNASATTDETDAALQAAKGSAWARVGDIVMTEQGEGVVTELDQATGTATIELSSTPEKTCVTLEKGNYQKKM
ncbi:hypothetical protein ACA910_008318 [Epithemia clementina (nom. ined.)]